MNKKSGSELRIGLSKTGVTVVHTRGWLQTSSEVIIDFPFSAEEVVVPETVAAHLIALLKETGSTGLPARIVLSDDWARRWMVTPPQNAARLADCQAAAQARFQVLFGDALSDWVLSADWDAKRPFLVCAIPKTLMNAFEQVAAECKLILLEIAPQSVLAWNCWRAGIKPGSWFGVLHQKMLTYIVTGEQGIEFTREVLLSDEVIREQKTLPEVLLREALRLNLPMPTEIRLCGEVPVHWVMQSLGGFIYARLDQNRIEPIAPTSGKVLAMTGMRP